MKRKWKEILSVMLICCMVLGGMNVVAAESGNVTVTEVSGKAGDTVQISVNLVKNPGIVSLYLGIGYDANVLKLDGVNNTGLLPDYQSGSLANNPVAVSWEDAATTVNHVETGTLVTMNFTILDNAQPGDYEISVSQYGSSNPYDVDLNDVDFEYQAGKITVEVSEHEHVFGKWAETKAADCTQEGERERHCTVEGCKEKEIEVISALGHDYGEWKTVVEATITAPGQEQRICSRCNYTESREIPQIQHGEADHVFDGTIEVITEADCTHEGMQKTYCSFSGCAAFQTTVIPAKGHSYGEWTVTKEAAIGIDGEKVRTCTVCQDEDKQIIPAIIHGDSDHVFDGRTEVIKEATCTEVGKLRAYCSFDRCMAYQDSDIPALGHTAGEWQTVKGANCTDSGLKEQYCTVCNNKIADEVIPATGHTFGEWQLVKAAGINTEGQEERICSTCQYKETRVIPAIVHGETDHTFNGKTEIIKEADCTHEGTKRVYCSFDGCSAYQDSAISALGHTLGVWTVAKEATCTEAGDMECYCTVCGQLADTRTIPAKGHSYSDWAVVKEATFNKDGLRERICEACDDKLQEIIPKLSDSHEHDFSGEQTVIKEATCTEKGKVSVRCMNPECDDVKVMDVPVLGHKFGEWIITKQAVVGIEGEKERVCAVCGQKEIAKIDALKQIEGNKETSSNANKTEAAKTVNAESRSVKTGDYSNAILWIAMAVIACGGIIVCIRKRMR